MNIDSRQALERLRDGNRRFASGAATSYGSAAGRRPADLIDGQSPIAVILGCSDSRVPAERIFDQDLGDLFVIRVAGNVIAPTQVGSVEFAVTSLGAPLVVVLGHSQCGAILTAMQILRARRSPASPGLRSIIDRVRPAVQQALAGPTPAAESELVARAVRANVRIAVLELERASRIIRDAIDQRRLLVIGAEYCLQSGQIEFFDDPVR